MTAVATNRSTAGTDQRGFTITELLVVIGIIVVLVGILLPALGKVNQRAKRTQTASTMEDFVKACESFRQEFGYLPGLVPEEILAADPKISGTENVLLHLMGGGISEDHPLFNAPQYSGWQVITFGSGNSQFRIRVNSSEVGKGPNIGGKQYTPFFTPREADICFCDGQIGWDGQPEQIGSDTTNRLPDLCDAWGMPILTLKAVRSVGNLVGEANGGSAPRTQFLMDPIYPYLNSDSLGEFGQSQAESILRTTTGLARHKTLAQIIRAPALGSPTQPESGTPKGSIVVISPGPDGIFFSRLDGPGSPTVPVINIVSGTYGSPEVVDRYDDIRAFGGG